MFPPHQGDGTERARMITTLGDFEVAHVRLVTEHLAHAGMGGNRVSQEATFGQHQGIMLRGDVISARGVILDMGLRPPVRQFCSPQDQ